MCVLGTNTTSILAFTPQNLYNYCSFKKPNSCSVIYPYGERMKTCSDIPTYHYFDTAPLAARYNIICDAIMAFIAAGRMVDMLRYSHKLVRLVRLFTKLETRNSLLKRKLEMLAHKPWRERVLKELGGVRLLRLWEAAQNRIQDRGKPAQLPRPVQEPSWLYTPERIAESERLKARVRMCRRATAHPLIFRDMCKMDFEGQFRLAPLPRRKQAARQVKVYTENTIVDYDWNNIPFAKVKGLGPATVWPAEFYAAMKAEMEILETRPAPSPIEYRDKTRSLPTVPLHSFLDMKTRQDLFTKIALETPPAFA